MTPFLSRVFFFSWSESSKIWGKPPPLSKSVSITFTCEIFSNLSKKACASSSPIAHHHPMPIPNIRYKKLFKTLAPPPIKLCCGVIIGFSLKSAQNKSENNRSKNSLIQVFYHFLLTFFIAYKDKTEEWSKSSSCSPLIFFFCIINCLL